MGTYLLKTPSSVKNSGPTEKYRHFEFSMQQDTPQANPSIYTDHTRKPKVYSSNQHCSFKIDDILNSSAISKRPSDHPSHQRMYERVPDSFETLKLPKETTNTGSSSSSSVSSASSHCSSVSSLPSPYQSTGTGAGNLLTTEFLLSHANSFLTSNPFMSIGNGQGFYPTIENKEMHTNFNNYTLFIDQLNLQKQQQQQSMFPFEYPKHQSVRSQTGISPLQFSNSGGSMTKSDDTVEKLSMIDQIAKQLDSYNESNSNVEKKQNETRIKLKNSKNSKLKEKNGHEIKNSDLNKKRASGHGCCGDLGCSSGMDQHQLPMCLRGTSDEQVHLASLFNTLIHHKKCRRTRTVFTDMQLIGLEKRFENQKYLSTPDRIQLADFLGLSQLQVKTWYQNRRMKWKKKVLKDGSKNAPTKPKGRPKKNSIPSFSDILKAAAAEKTNSSDSISPDSLRSSSGGLKNSSIDESRSMCTDDEEEEIELSDDDENEEIYDVEDSDEEEENVSGKLRGYGEGINDEGLMLT